MDSQKFKQWLVNVKGQRESAAAARVAGAMRIDAEYDIYNNYYVVGKKDDLMELFKYSKTDEKHGVRPLVNITINGNIYDGRGCGQKPGQEDSPAKEVCTQRKKKGRHWVYTTKPNP